MQNFFLNLIIPSTLILFISGCSVKSENEKSTEPSMNDSLSKKPEDKSGNQGFYFKNDLLSKEEKDLLNVLHGENEDILTCTDSVRRIYSNDSVLILNQIIIPSDSLSTKGYVSYRFEFLGKISNVKISYDYNLGQADYGFGDVYGASPDDYYHTFTSYGMSAKVITVFNAGKKIFFQTVDLKTN